MNIIDFQNIVKTAFSFITGNAMLNDIGFGGNSVTIKNTEGKADVYVAFDGTSNAPKLQYKNDEFSLIGKDGALKALKSVPFSYTNIDFNTVMPIKMTDMIISTTLDGETIVLDMSMFFPIAGDRIVIKHVGQGTTRITGHIDDKDSIELSMNGISVTLVYADQWYLV